MPPHVRIRPATEADIDDMVQVHNQAFGPGVMNRLMYPKGQSAESDAMFASGTREELASKPSRKSGEEQIWVAELVEEGKEPELVAFAKWTVFREQRPEEEWNVPVSLGPSDPVRNEEVYREFIGGLKEMRRKWMKGDPAILLGLLCCKPQRHRMGAGSALVRWGTELADKEGLVAWLEASPEGVYTYKKFGYKPVEVMDLKVKEKWGGEPNPGEDWGHNSAVELGGEVPEGVFRTCMMKREPVQK